MEFKCYLCTYTISSEMKFIIPLMLFLMLPTACSITEQNPGNAITRAETMIEHGEFIEAQDVCNELLSDSVLNCLGVSHWCRMAIVYMQLAETCSPEDNTASAIECYRKAFDLNADSATAYFEHIEIGKAQYVFTLSILSSSIDTPSEFTEFEFNDTSNIDSI